jgi:hypothetical protein
MPRQANPRPQETRAVKFDAEDEQLLIAIARAEKLTVSDIIRRAVRAYAKQLGVVPDHTQPAEQPNPKASAA